VNVRPFRGCLLVRRIDDKETAAGGSAVPRAAEGECEAGKVLAVGPGHAAGGVPRAVSEIKVGDRIVFGGSSEIRIDGQAVLVVREDQVLAVLASRSPAAERVRPEARPLPDDLDLLPKSEVPSTSKAPGS
jgi:co-chaperonin GroES (HSP10)